ncbi:MAG: glycoside hydrolase family 99-like domain-containing protein [Candidatus Margulisiibacteriota bacterium]
MTELARLIAFYLPQFYPVPENDAWWGEGFTEWTNVKKAESRYPGHYQPRVPAELGYYDLRSAQVRENQAQLAREYGIYGFCYYHYWTMGKMMLALPLREMLASGKPDFPFCLCWGNHNWTRRWDGLEEEMLLKQEYSPADDLNHINYLLPIFADRRYIRVDGKPLFAVHLAQCLPDPERTAAVWRGAAAGAGLPGLYLVNVENNFGGNGYGLVKGFDATIEFAPDARSVGQPLFGQDLTRKGYADNRVFYYDTVVRNMLNKPDVGYKRFRGVFPGWDNSARRRNIPAHIYHGSTPAKYREFLEKMLQNTCRTFSGEERLLFVNAWNEWGEGCYLEPDRKFGRAYLEATRDALTGTAEKTIAVSVVIPHYNKASLLDRCLETLCAQAADFDFEIIVVDNASTDGSAALVRGKYPAVRYIVLDKNHLFARACNEGIKVARGRYIALLNNDTEVDRHWLAALKTALDNDPEAGFCASRVYFADDRVKIDTAGDSYTIAGTPHKIGHGVRTPGAYAQRRYVFGASASSSIYRRELFERVGLLDEDLFFSHEDVDLSFRAQLAGYKCLYVPEAIVYHKVSATIGQLSANYVYLSQRNVEYVYFKNMPTRLLAKYAALHFIFNLGALVYAIRQRRLFSYLRAKTVFLSRLGVILRKRREIQRGRLVPDSYIASILQKSWFRLKLKKALS